jgi:hypothetical protein
MNIIEGMRYPDHSLGYFPQSLQENPGISTTTSSSIVYIVIQIKVCWEGVGIAQSS